MRGFRIILSSLLLVIIIVSLNLSCNKEKGSWKPDAMMKIQPDSGLTTQTFDLTIDLLNLPSSQEVFYIRWDLNSDSVWDAPFSADQKISYRFLQKGIHEVRAEILTEDGQSIILKQNVQIKQGYSAPHAQFTTDPPEGNYMTEFTFDASKTFDDEDPFSTLLFRWDFDNNGGWDTESSSNPIAKYRFNKQGEFSVKLSVTDPTNRTISETKSLVVNMHENKILPDFTWTPQEATVKDTFLLDATSTRHETDSTRVFTYTWEIKSETTYGPFPEPKFKHQFKSAGTQHITLTATDQYGLSNSMVKEFFVIKENKPPNPKILVATPYGNITTNFYLSAWPSLDDVTQPSDLLVRWDFDGDGTWDTGWSDEKVIFHQFEVPGTYWVKLEAEDEGGERNITQTRILVSSSTAATGYILDRRDWKYYGTVKIGTQWWMSDNLDWRSDWKMDIPMLSICYQEEKGMCDLYGSLYQGERAVVFNNAGKNICPEGWRVPTKEDWLVLRDNIPKTGGRDAMVVGGSVGFNARYTGSGGFQFKYDSFGIITDTIFHFTDLYTEVKYLSLTTRPFQSEFMSQFYMGLIRISEQADFMWGDLNGYFYVRCLKNE
jgi:uncharacterized protein (TIGR02145 family)